jgi:hypothetical protein
LIVFSQAFPQKKLHWTDWTSSRQAFKQQMRSISYDAPCDVPGLRRKAKDQPEGNLWQREALRLLRQELCDTLDAEG